MKSKLSISMNQQTVSILDKAVKSGRFRNKSHVIEFAVNKLIGDDKNG